MYILKEHRAVNKHVFKLLSWKLEVEGFYLQ